MMFLQSLMISWRVSMVDFDKFLMIEKLADKKAKLWTLLKVDLYDDDGRCFQILGYFATESEVEKALGWVMENRPLKAKQVYTVSSGIVTKWKGD